MSAFFRNGNSFKPADEAKMDLVRLLPPSNFIIEVDRMTEQLFLEQVESFTLPLKLYGNTNRHADRILNTFADRAASTGVLLSGEKGSGKTLLAKTLSVHGAALGYPTIIVNAAWTGDKFNKLIQDINQPCIVFFDEFEKTYDSEHQESLLTLLDGTFSSKKLFVLTCNDSWRIDNHMRNRPGRIFYSLDFKGLDIEFVREYCADNLDNQRNIDQVCQVAAMFDQFNFDMLKAIIEDMNRYNESAYDTLEMLNTKPQGEKSGRYNMVLTVDGKSRLTDAAVWDENPMSEQTFRVYFKMADDDAPEEADCDRLVPSTSSHRNVAEFVQSDLKRIEPAEGRLVYVNAAGDVVVFTRIREKLYDYRSALMA